MGDLLPSRNRSSQEIIEQTDSQNRDQYPRGESSPHESLDHVFRFQVQRALGTTTHIWLKQVSAIAAGFCDHHFLFDSQFLKLIAF